MKTTKNSARVIGNLTADPVLRSTKSDRPVCNFTVATNELRKSSDGEGYEQFAEFHDCVGWGPQAENLHKRLRKGDLVSIEGPLRTRVNKTETATYRNTTIEVRGWDLLHRPGAVREGGAGEEVEGAEEAGSA